MDWLVSLIRSILRIFGVGAPSASHEVQGLPAAPRDSEVPAAQVASSAAPDLAGFDPDDEDAFFDAVVHMESEGLGGGTDESRALVMARFGIASRSHWQEVKPAVYEALVDKHGSFEAVMQREMNFRQGRELARMQTATAARVASGDFEPVEGISLEQWAAMNAAIAQGAHPEDLLKGSAIDPARWDRVKAEWEGRMARDTTFAITSAYGVAFQNASTGKYASEAKEANVARSENRDLACAIPMSLEAYWRILHEQSYGSKLGKDPAQVLRDQGLSVVDWCDLSSVMGYHIQRTWAANHTEYQAVMASVEAEFKARYPDTAHDLDIQF